MVILLLHSFTPLQRAQAHDRHFGAAERRAKTQARRATPDAQRCDTRHTWASETTHTAAAQASGPCSTAIPRGGRLLQVPRAYPESIQGAPPPQIRSATFIGCTPEHRRMSTPHTAAEARNDIAAGTPNPFLLCAVAGWLSVVYRPSIITEQKQGRPPTHDTPFHRSACCSTAQCRAGSGCRRSAQS